MPIVKWSRKTKLSKLLKECGPITRLPREDVSKLTDADWRRVVCIEYGEKTVHGRIGFGVVNVDEQYLLAKPAPEPVSDIYDIWWGDGEGVIPNDQRA